MSASKHDAPPRSGHGSTPGWLPGTRPVYLAASLVSVVVLAALIFSARIITDTFDRYLPLTDAVLEIRIEAAEAHVVLEEIRRGAPEATTQSALAHLSRAYWFVEAMLYGGQDRNMVITPLDDPELRDALLDVRDIIEQLGAVTSRETTQTLLQPPSGIDSEYDTMFAQLSAATLKSETLLKSIISARTSQYTLINRASIFTAVGLWLTAMIYIYRYERSLSTHLLAERQAKRQAEEHQRLLVTTLRSMGDGVATTDIHGDVSYLNPAAAKLIGHSLGSALQRPAGEVLRLTDVKDEAVHPVREVITTGRPFQSHDLLLRGTDGKRPVTLNAAPILDAKGQLNGVVVVFRDIAEQKRAEEAALAASKAKSEFLANMSHELRTPISGIMGMTELLRATDDDPQRIERIQLIRHSARTLLSIVSDVLDLAKVESGKLQLVEAPFSTREVIHNVERTFRLQAENKGLGFGVEIAPEVPVALLGDATRIEQVLRNLVSNAVKFTDHGRVDIRVQSFGATPRGTELSFSVTDTGIGIPAGRRGELFENFTQLDASQSKRYAGTGLGLTICKEMLSLMGGSIDVQSVEGRGSTFSFRLGLKQAPQSMLEAAQNEDSRGVDDAASAASLEPLDILVAEDDATNRMYIEYLLRQIGHRVTVARDGRHAMQTLKKHRFDLILMDVQMPDMGGLELTRTIRASTGELGDPQVPIVALTAYSMKGDRERLLEGGMDGYLAKPLDENEFAREVSRVLDARKDERLGHAAEG